MLLVNWICTFTLLSHSFVQQFWHLWVVAVIFTFHWEKKSWALFCIKILELGERNNNGAWNFRIAGYTNTGLQKFKTKHVPPGLNCIKPKFSSLLAVSSENALTQIDKVSLANCKNLKLLHQQQIQNTSQQKVNGTPWEPTYTLAAYY